MAVLQKITNQLQEYDKKISIERQNLIAKMISDEVSRLVQEKTIELERKQADKLSRLVQEANQSIELERKQILEKAQKTADIIIENAYKTRDYILNQLSENDDLIIKKPQIYLKKNIY